MNYKLGISGQWVDSKAGHMLTFKNPATGEKLAEVVDASREDVDRAVQAAHTAFYDGRWSRLTPGERSLAIWKLGDLLEKRLEEFARVESENTGKPFGFVSMGADLPFTIDNLRFFAAAARDTHGYATGEYAKGFTSMYRREPVGVVGQIAPWNYPLMMAVWKMGPALAAGCTLVFKPAPSTPLTALMLAELTAEAGIPAGVVNVITVTINTGKKIKKTAADTLKRVHLELGGKAPFIVFDDVDIDAVAATATLAATFNTGQDFTAATRIYIQQGQQAKVREALVEAM